MFTPQPIHIETTDSQQTKAKALPIKDSQRAISWQQWLLLAFLAIGLVLSSKSFAADPINTGFFSNVAIKGYDPVAYFTEDKPVKGSSKHELEWMGATWRFSSADHKTLFESNPEKYAPQYGGYCAYAVAKDSLAGIDPKQFTVLDGKLYLNYNANIQKKWTANRDNFIVSADKNWPNVLDK